MSTLLADLTRRPDCADVLHALILLADHLDRHGSPIDYARRRALFGTRTCFVALADWLHLERRLRANHTPDIAHAQRWIFHTLTGSPPHLAHPAIAPVTAAQRQQYKRFRWRSVIFCRKPLSAVRPESGCCSISVSTACCSASPFF
ncbi:hypothetical protein [Streptomyces brasiliensis]|uniref:Uncharacterized protein n=1 Tax=Streptomyces brasiliensis TaxID=1954 RepID=A0A917PDD6_9ACTN|nr:hypothetical protein GCM10010121_097670 [Streptomyces brasiliensis]